MKLNHFIALVSLFFLSVPSFSAESEWAGFYLGGNVGEGINSSNDQTILYSNGGIAGSSYVTAFNAAGQQALSFNNFMVGAQAGYNRQINQWIIGFETNYNAATQASGSQNTIVPSTPGDYDGQGSSNITQSIYQSWNFTIRPRIGYIINHFLIYATGGFALSKITYTSDTDWNNTDGDLLNDNTTINQALPGWAAGMGIEWKITPYHWSLNAQYLYEGFQNFSRLTSVNNSDNDPNASLNHKGQFNSNVLTVGINYLF